MELRYNDHAIIIVMIVISLLYVNAQGKVKIEANSEGSVISKEEKGIIKKDGWLRAGNEWPKEGVTPYDHLLECDYRHYFPKSSWTYTYDIHCNRMYYEGEVPLLQLSINYDNNVLDVFNVTSCKLEDVIRSIFPPAQTDKVLDKDEFELDDLDRPTISYLKYKTEDGECYARKYKYVNRASRAAMRSVQEKIKCERNSVDGLNKNGDVAEFTNCRVPELKFSKLVKSYSEQMPQTKKVSDVLLECSYDQFSKLYNLKCYKDGNGEYVADVTYQYRLLDRFTVTSCHEEKILTGIYPMKETTASPEGTHFKETLYFVDDKGDCFKGVYKYRPNRKHDKFDCPTEVKWLNPSWGYAGLWRECAGPCSTKESTDSTKCPQEDETLERNQDGKLQEQVDKTPGKQEDKTPGKKGRRTIEITK